MPLLLKFRLLGIYLLLQVKGKEGRLKLYSQEISEWRRGRGVGEEKINGWWDNNGGGGKHKRHSRHWGKVKRQVRGKG